MKNLIYLCLVAVGLMSCNRDYVNDGGVADPYQNMTTYDFLRTNRLFDTLVIAIDRAGLKSVVNEAKTFYVPTNYAFAKYVEKQLSIRRQLDPEALYSFDSIPVNTLHDSLKIYMFNETLTRDVLVKEGKVYTSLCGVDFKLSKEPEILPDYELVYAVDLLYFIKKRGNYFDKYGVKIEDIPAKERDARVRVQTSGIITNTGVVHVLQNAHELFFCNNY